MTSSAVEAEATGQEFIGATFGGTTFQVPLDVDSWPLDLLRICCGLTPGGEAIVNRAAVAGALQELMGEQWTQLNAVVLCGRDLVSVSHVFATAVGIPADSEHPEDVAFGGIPRLLGLLDREPAKVEANLARTWGLDYKDRWRFDRKGRRRLTLRQIYVRLSTEQLSDTARVVMDLFEQMTGRRHPSRPMSQAEIQTRLVQQQQEEKARADYHERQRTRETEQQNLLENARANRARVQPNEESI